MTLSSRHAKIEFFDQSGPCCACQRYMYWRFVVPIVGTNIREPRKLPVRYRRCADCAALLWSRIHPEPITRRPMSDAMKRYNAAVKRKATRPEATV